MSLLNIGIVFNVKQSSATIVKGTLHSIQQTAVGVSGEFVNLKKTINSIGQTQSFLTLSAAISNLKSNVSAAVGMFKSVFYYASNFAAAGDKIAKTSRMLGLSVREYQAFSSAAQHAGMSVGELDVALRQFNVRQGKARAGDKTAGKAFDALLPKGLSAYKSNAEIIKALADSFSKLESAEQRAFAAQEIFGESGVKMTELFSGGNAGIEQLLADFDAHGGGFSEEGATAAEEFNDRLQDVRETFDSLKISVAQELLPAFIDMFETIRDYLQGNGSELRKNLVDIGKAFSGLVKDLLPKIPGVLESLSKINPVAVAIVGGLAAAAPVVFNLAIAFASLGKICGSVLPLIGRGILRIGLATARIAAGPIGLVITGFLVWKSVIKDVYDNWDMLVSFIVDDCGGALKKWFDELLAVTGFLWSGFKTVFVDPFVNFFAAIPDAVSDLVDGFIDGIRNVKDLFSNLASTIYDSIVGAVKNAWASVKSFMADIPVIGGLFEDEVPGQAASPSVSAVAAEAVQSSSVTTTNRFAVDFRNMPQGVSVTPPAQGDFDFSYGYSLGGF